MSSSQITLAAFAAVVFTVSTACSGGSDGVAGAGFERVGTNSQAVTVCAGGSTVNGVDVSTYQGSVDWTSVHAAGIDFAFTRVSDGTTTPDDTFATNWAGIKAAGMVRGAYQYFRASEDPTAQADLVASSEGTLGSGDLSPVADVETLDGESGATLVANLATWVTEIKSKTGRTPMIYASPGFWDDLPSTSQFASELSWVANWDVSCPDTSTPWTTWTFWQNADNGSVSGISGAVDTDVFNGTLAQLQALGGPAPYAAQYVSQSFPLATSALTMTAGQTIPSYIELKNVGSATWDSSTRIGTTQPRDRTSVFADSSWVSPNRPAQVTGTVPPGGTFKFTFNLHAPATTGTYDEYFGVVQDGVAWFSDPGQGGPPDNDLEAQIKVVAAPPGSDKDAGGAASDDGGAGGSSSGGQGAADDGGASSGQADDAGVVLGAPTSTTAGDDGGSNADAPSTQAGGCTIASRPRGSSMWGIVVGLAFALASLRRRK
ncbi:MAG: glycoside hydrolase family 25 protein [Polyangiaceae bacterium]